MYGSHDYADACRIAIEKTLETGVNHAPVPDNESDKWTIGREIKLRSVSSRLPLTIVLSPDGEGE